LTIHLKITAEKKLALSYLRMIGTNCVKRMW